jgi:hypothetical protein
MPEAQGWKLNMWTKVPVSQEVRPATQQQSTVQRPCAPRLLLGGLSLCFALAGHCGVLVFDIEGGSKAGDAVLTSYV